MPQRRRGGVRGAVRGAALAGSDFLSLLLRNALAQQRQEELARLQSGLIGGRQQAEDVRSVLQDTAGGDIPPNVGESLLRLFGVDAGPDFTGATRQARRSSLLGEVGTGGESALSPEAAVQQATTEGLTFQRRPSAVKVPQGPQVAGGVSFDEGPPMPPGGPGIDPGVAVNFPTSAVDVGQVEQDRFRQQATISRQGFQELSTADLEAAPTPFLIDVTNKPGQFSPNTVAKATAHLQGRQQTDELLPKDKQLARGLFRDFMRESEPFLDRRDNFLQIQDAAQNPSPAGDIAMVFNFMKMLDPTSVVREGEFATARNAAGVPDRIRALYNRILEGDQLAGEQRQDLFQRSRSIFEQAQVRQQEINREFGDLAQRSGIPPAAVTVDFFSGGQEQAQQPSGEEELTELSEGEIRQLAQNPNITPADIELLTPRERQLFERFRQEQ